MRIVAIIQARMGSTRLPGKVMMKISGKTILEHVITRVGQSELIDEIIIATTTKSDDDSIVEESKKLDINYYRGSEDDVLSRYYYAAKENNADIVIRITSDCPLIDPNVINDMIIEYINNDYDMLSNGGLIPAERTFPRGLDVAIFRFDVLEEAFLNAKENYEREHVSPYIYENKKVFYYKNTDNLSYHRWTLDTPEDLNLISNIYSNLYKGKHDFYMKEIINLFEESPGLININRHIEQKKVK